MTHLLLLLCTFLLGSICLQAQQRDDSSGTALGRNALQQAQADVQALVSPEMQGRGYTGNGHRRAAEYLRSRFQEIGLRFVNDSGLQAFSVVVDTFRTTPSLVVDGHPLRFGQDFIINPGNAGGKKEQRTAVNAAYGLVIPERERNDFAERPIKGGVAVIETGTPEELRSDTAIDRNLLSTAARIKNALQAGAAAVILLVERPTYGNFAERWPVPVFELRREALPENARTISFSVDPAHSVKVLTNNVVGYLPGTGESDSVIIICAHYDHLGGVGEGIYFPGANDNASGTALILALAKRFAEHPLRYNILVVAFSGEEIGLRGSRFFAENMPVAPEHIRFLVNLDMAASGLEGVMAVGGTDFPEEYALLQSVHDSLGLPELRKRPNAPNSDHWFILKLGARGFYLYPFTGAQPYHHVNDLPETLQWNTFERMYALVEGLLERL